MSLTETIRKQDEEFEKILKDYKIIITDAFVNSEPKELIKSYIHRRDQAIAEAVIDIASEYMESDYYLNNFKKEVLNQMKGN